MNWVKDKAASDVYLPQIKAIIGRHLIQEPPAEEDQERNTDLIVLRLDAVRIACRVRSDTYREKYGNEFTIRAGRPSGVKTELTKIIEGWGQYLFYGFGDGKRLTRWTLADLNVFRVEFMRMVARNYGSLPGVEKNNIDGSSSFRVFRWSDFSESLIVGQNMHSSVASLFGEAS